jgi:hypothetical protein
VVRHFLIFQDMSIYSKSRQWISNMGSQIWGQGLISDYISTTMIWIWYERPIARPWRIEYEGALYHVFSRGNNQQGIFVTDDDRYLV